MVTNTGHPRYPVIIIGGGIGGLAVAVLLAQQGHAVTVLERRSESYITNSSGGIAIWYNARKIITGVLGLERELLTISDDTNKSILRAYSTGDVLGEQTKPQLSSFVHRADLLRVLHTRASELGVDIRLGQQITKISDSGPQVVVTLSDATKLEANLVIGADGIESQTRSLIFPHLDVSAVPTGDCVFLVNVPREVMQSHPETAKLWSDPPFNFFRGAGRSIVAWTMTTREVFHLQFCEHEYGNGFHYGFTAENPDMEQWVQPFGNMPDFRRRWKDYSPGIRHILASTKTSIKWKIGQVPALDSWSSKTGRVILLGDAAHGFPPFAGQGACTTLEDAAALARLIDMAPMPEVLPNIAKVYYDVRWDRIERMLRIIWDNIEVFADVDQVTERARKHIMALDNKRKTVPNSSQEQGKRWTSGGSKWVESYDAVAEVENHWRRHHSIENAGNSKL